MSRRAISDSARCAVQMVHGDLSEERCTRAASHVLQDTDHIDWHGCKAPVLVHQSSIRNIQHIGWLYPDGVHTRGELRVMEPGRRDYDAPCPCGCGEEPS